MAMTMPITVDARGLDCPKPVINTKEALERANGQPMMVMVSNVASRDNVIRFLERNGAKVDRVEEKGGEFYIYTGASAGQTGQSGQTSQAGQTGQAGRAGQGSQTVQPGQPRQAVQTVQPGQAAQSGQAKVELRPEDYTCTPQPAVAGTTLFITKDRIGLGSDELGTNLLKAFLATIKELSIQPRTICFMNSGVKLTIKGAETLEHLRELEERGIEILVCGTCLNYFNLSHETGVGKVSNMYDISETMLKSTKVITI